MDWITSLIWTLTMHTSDDDVRSLVCFFLIENNRWKSMTREIFLDEIAFYRKTKWEILFQVFLRTVRKEMSQRFSNVFFTYKTMKLNRFFLELFSWEMKRPTHVRIKKDQAKKHRPVFCPDLKSKIETSSRSRVIVNKNKNNFYQR